MHWLITISFALICIFFIWRIYMVIKANPEMLSKENVTRSFSSMAILALILIGAVTLMVFLLRST